MNKFTEAVKANKKTIIKTAIIATAVAATVIVVGALYKTNVAAWEEVLPLDPEAAADAITVAAE